MPIESRLPPGVPALTTYYMYITGGCNLACRHCWITPSFEPEGNNGQNLDFDLFKLAIGQARPLGLAKIKFTGGEPLLHPQFTDLVDYATQAGLSCWMETNGTLVSRDLAFHLREHTSLWSVSVSIDGATPAVHDYIRNVKGSLELAKRGVGFLVEAGLSVQVIMSLFSGNVDEIEEVVSWAVQAGCQSVKFNLIQPSGRGQIMKMKDQLLTLEELVRVGRWVMHDLRPRVSIPLHYGWPMAFNELRNLWRSAYEVCTLHNILGVLSSGHLALCGIGTQVADLVYGQLGVDDVQSLWVNHPLLKQLRESIPERLTGVCGRCIFKQRCIGSCVAQNYLSSKELTAPFWFCEQALEAGLFPATRLLSGEYLQSM